MEHSAGAAEPWRGLATTQAGVVARRQLLELGYTSGQVGALLDSRRWTGLLPGVYAVFKGPVPPMTRAWAAVLAGGCEAALAGEAALWLWGVLDVAPKRLAVCVPWERRVVPPEGIDVMRRRRLAALVHPAGRPPRLRLEEALLDVVDGSPRPSDVVGIVLRATAGRRTTPPRIRAAMAGRKRLRHRRLLCDILGDAAEGVQSALERRYRKDVERAHALPRGERNRAELVPDGRGRRVRNRYRDVRYRRWGTVVELDGLEAHPQWLRHLDRRRDNSVVVAGDRGLQYGWHEVVSDPCRVAAEVSMVLWRGGWRGVPRPCGPQCPVSRLVPSGDDAHRGS